jgi:hypothetical protein
LSETAGFIPIVVSHMDTVPVWVNLLNPVRRLTNSADCNPHRARLCANGRFWRKADIGQNANIRKVP